ncbi:ATP synthase protein I [Roseateles toxinivorans]|uniref:ATP synthase protein I n=2 Tax=Roseateles toxinivorans TaxID=270368 RepID=A0A4R6QI52_9BURK|nr:ATP synthase protein I [Roseateles toxinivorans]
MTTSAAMSDLVKNDVSVLGPNAAAKATPKAVAGWEDETERQTFKPLTREEAQVLRAEQPSISPWRVVAMQAAVGVVCCLVAWLATGKAAVVWSALYGVAAVVLPSALLARGMTKRAGSAVGVAIGFLFWEMLKIGAAIAMLVIAAKVVPNLSWPALLITMVVCMKVNWFALLWRGR